MHTKFRNYYWNVSTIKGAPVFAGISGVIKKRFFKRSGRQYKN